jgi:hypothetical protein
LDRSLAAATVSTAMKVLLEKSFELPTDPPGQMIWSKPEVARENTDEDRSRFPSLVNQLKWSGIHMSPFDPAAYADFKISICALLRDIPPPGDSGLSALFQRSFKIMMIE